MSAAPIDISMPLADGIPLWPGSPGASMRLLKSLADGDPADATELTIEVHTGTHLDAPSHTLPGAPTMSDYGLEVGIGAALVADTGAAAELDADVLEGLGVPAGTERLLLKTRNSRTEPPLHSQPFTEDYAALTVSGSEWLVANGIRLVGIDYLSIQRFEAPLETHHVLLRAGISILEGLRLDRVEPGRWELICLPLSLPGREAAPARAVLREVAG